MRSFSTNPPRRAVGAQAILLIDGGSWKDEFEAAPQAGEEISANVKTLLQAGDLLECPIVVVKQVPQQPLFNNLHEDGLISYTFAQYLLSGDGDWPLLFPMVKSAVRAMDVAQKVASEEWELKIPKFLVTGASKRGWTTWLSATVDSRVNAIAPMVIDTLNMAPQLQQQLAYYGKFSDQLKDYTEKGLPRFLLTPRGRELIAAVDPYSYRAVIKQPKLIILGTNDPYWTVDALNLYYDQLVGEKFILYVPNAGHGIKDYPRILGGIGGLYTQITAGEKMPQLDWKWHETPASYILEVESSPAPDEVTLWTAEAGTRDFRPARFHAKNVSISEGKSRIEIPRPAMGYAATFAEAKYARKPFDLRLSTQIRVLETAPVVGKDQGTQTFAPPGVTAPRLTEPPR
ncbi:MAG: PhoPQ-activated protein PqaA family protein [Pirellulales bacterium]